MDIEQIGTFCGHANLSKDDNDRPRGNRWLAGQVVIGQRENRLRDKCECYGARDRHDADLRSTALTAITAKMAHVVHAVLKTGGNHPPFAEGSEPVAQAFSAES